MDSNLYTTTATIQHSIPTASYFSISTGKKIRSVSRLDHSSPGELKFQKQVSSVFNSLSSENDVQLKPRPRPKPSCRPRLAPVLDYGSEEDAIKAAADVATSSSQLHHHHHHHHSSILCAQIEKLVLFGKYREALELFDFLRFRGNFSHVAFRSVIYDKLVSACVVLRSIHDVKSVFQHMVETGFEFDQYMWNRVLLMHVKCGMMVDADFLFDEMPRRNESSWNIMISGLVDSGRYAEAFHTFLLMWESEDSYEAGTRIFTHIICTSAALELLPSGRQLHSCVLKLGLSQHAHVSNALIDMYCKCGCIEEAWWVFAEMPEKTVVAWNTIIYGYALNGHSEEALEVYYEMRDSGTAKMDHFTYSIILRIFSRLASSESVRQTHASLIRNGFAADIVASTSLIDFYGKWGRMNYARNVFDGMPYKNIISWNALIGGYRNHGRGKEAIQAFEQMILERMVPNHVTFLSLLGACSGSAGLGSSGWEFFRAMSRQHNMKPRAMHYACMVEIMAGRDGLLDEAYYFIKNAPFKPTANMWGALLTACRFHGNVEVGKIAAEKLFEIAPWKIGDYIVLLNIYINSGRLDEANKVLEVMNRRGLKIPRPCSWIEIKREPHMFEFNDISHPESDRVYGEIDRLMRLLGKFGYVNPLEKIKQKLKPLVPDNDSLGDEETGGGGSRRYHSEKLAVGLGLISTSKSGSLQVVQRHRMCTDCHKVIKLIALITGRVITLRDSSRFHHFQDGDCSCGDYW